MYDPNTRVSHELNRIGYLGRSFTLDNPNLLTWARNLKHSKSQFRRQVTSYNNEDPDLLSTTEALKSHYDFLDTAVTNLINILHTKNIPKYSHRDAYLKKQLFKHKQRYYKTILQYQQHITDYTEWPIGDRAMEEIKLKYKLNDAEDDSQPKQIWFKLSFEQLFDDENEIRQLLNECHRRLPAYFQDEIELNLSVKLPNKVGRYLN
eukprot:994303_1